MEVLAETESQVLQALNKLELLIENNDFICGKQYSIAVCVINAYVRLYFLSSR